MNIILSKIKLKIQAINSPGVKESRTLLLKIELGCIGKLWDSIILFIDILYTNNLLEYSHLPKNFLNTKLINL